MQVVLSGFSVRLFCFVQATTLCRYGCMYFLAVCRCDGDVICVGQCFPTGAPRWITKGSAGDDITNKKNFKNWGPLDRQNEIDRTNEYTYNIPFLF